MKKYKIINARMKTIISLIYLGDFKVGFNNMKKYKNINARIKTIISLIF